MPTSDPAEVERGFRKLAFHYGLKALSGVAIMVVAAHIPFPSKWWDLPFMLVGAGLLLYNLTLLSILAGVYARYRHGPEDTTPLKHQERTERAVHIGSFVVLGITLLGMKPMARFAENIVEEGRFTLVMGGVGVVLAAFVLWWIKRTVPGYFERNNEARAGAVLGLFFSIVVVVVLGSAWIDRSSAMARERVQRFAVKDTGTNIKSGSAYVTLFLPGQRTEDFRIQVRGKELASMAGRDSIDLRVGRGDLAFEHVLGVASSE